MSSTRTTSERDGQHQSLSEIVEDHRENLERIASDDDHPTQWVAQAFLNYTDD